MAILQPAVNIYGIDLSGMSKEELRAFRNQEPTTYIEYEIPKKLEKKLEKIIEKEIREYRKSKKK